MHEKPFFQKAIGVVPIVSRVAIGPINVLSRHAFCEFLRRVTG